MRRPLGDQAFVVAVVPAAVVALAPTEVGVLTRLVRQHRDAVVGEVDFTLIVRAGQWLVHASQRSSAGATTGRGHPLVPNIGSVGFVTQPSSFGEPNPYRAEGYDEDLWRRPEDSARPTDGFAGTSPDGLPPVYTGPPRSTPPPPGWRPPTVIQVPQARVLPPQDLEAIDNGERQASVTTYGVGLIAGAIALLVLVILCGRALF